MVLPFVMISSRPGRKCLSLRLYARHRWTDLAFDDIYTEWVSWYEGEGEEWDTRDSRLRAQPPLGNICSAFYINKMDNDITLRIRKKLFALCLVLGVKVFNNPTNPAQPATLNIVGNKVHRTKYSRATELNPQHKVVQWVVANDKNKDKTATWIQSMCLTMGQPEWVEEQMCIYSWSNPGYWQVWTDGRTLYTFPAAQRTDRARFVAQIERGDRARRPL